MRMANVTDAVSFVREIVRQAMWDIAYHEHALPKAQQELEYAKTMMKRGGFNEDATPADLTEDGDHFKFKNVTQFALSFFEGTSDSVEHHEEGLRDGYRALAFAKMMLLRGSYTEIDLKEIEKEVAEEVRKWEED